MDELAEHCHLIRHSAARSATAKKELDWDWAVGGREGVKW
jgi:hypothetical protein